MFQLIPAILNSNALNAVTAGTRLQINLVTDDIEAANGLKYELEDLALENAYVPVSFFLINNFLIHQSYFCHFDLIIN